ncbi:MAG: hypothetical protein Q7S16_02675 [bacterium]|nr:hypothetical protein [bacterium]
MGSHIELNDTLQITEAQGFPRVLKLTRHLKKSFVAKDFTGKVFSFRDKSGIRVYHTPPVRNFLVENRGGKWIYWGLCEILSVTHDNKKQITSGTFRVLYIYTPDEMKQAHALIDRNPKTQFFT